MGVRTCGETSESLEGPKRIEVLDDLRVFYRILQITGPLLTAPVRDSAAEGVELAAAVEELLLGDLAIVSSPLKRSRALVIENVPAVVVGLPSQQRDEAAIGGKDGHGSPTHTVRFGQGAGGGELTFHPTFEA